MIGLCEPVQRAVPVLQREHSTVGRRDDANPFEPLLARRCGVME